MPEIGTSSSMSGDGKRSDGLRPPATAPVLDSTYGPRVAWIMSFEPIMRMGVSDPFDAAKRSFSVSIHTCSARTLSAEQRRS